MKARSIVSISCFLTLALAACGVLLAQKGPGTGSATGSEPNNLVFRVYFDDLQTAYRLAAGFEPMESNYDSGYLVFHLSRDEYRKLREIALKLGLRVEVDVERTQYFEELAERLAARPPEVTTRTISGYSCYRTVEETFAAAQALVTARSDLASWIDIGDSWEKTESLGGYDIMVLRLTNSAIGGDKPKFIATSAIHAREYTTAELATRFAEYLVNNHGVDADATWILDYHEVHLILQLNPDGRKMAEAGASWRKNTNQDYCGPTSSSRGADLNRNFPFEWGCCGGSSGSECSTTYRGPSAESEPEMQAIVDYLLEEFPDQRGPDEEDAAPDDATGIYLDIHSSGQLVLWSWGYTTDPPPNPQLATIGRKLAYINDHVPGQGPSLYVTDGSSKDFGYGELGVASFVFELGTQFFEQCGVFTDLVLAKNLPALIYTAKLARTPYITAGGPDILNLRLGTGFNEDFAVSAGTMIDIKAYADDTRFNHVSGTETTQTVAGAEFTIDTPPWEMSASPEAMDAVDGTFNGGLERVEGVIDTTGLSEGRHIVYVRAEDSNGDFGPVSAIFLYIDDEGATPTTLFADDFESDNGWTVNPSSTDTATTGQWARANPEGTQSTGSNQTGPKQRDITPSGSLALVTGASAGASEGANDIDGGVTTVRSPNIVLTPGVANPTLIFSYYMAHTTNSSSDDYLRVTVVGNTSQMVFEELGAAADDDGEYQTAAIDLSAFTGQTVYLLVAAADNGGGSIVEAAIDDVRIIGVSSGGNAAPYVNAGADQEVTLAEGANLDGTVVDDGLPNPPAAVTTLWSQVSGPGTATFDDEDAVDTSVDFSVAGTYVLRLEADDSELDSSDDVTITVNAEASFTVLSSDNFESGFGSYTDGGSDCRRSSADAAFAHQGTYCIRLRDNTGAASSFYTTNGIDLTGYDEFKIEFWYMPVSMENGENLFVEFWNGSTWQVVADYVAGTHFSNNNFYNPSITINDTSYNFTSGARIRIRCDASNDSDYIYVDEVVVSAR